MLHETEFAEENSCLAGAGIEATTKVRCKPSTDTAFMNERTVVVVLAKAAVLNAGRRTPLSSTEHEAR